MALAHGLAHERCMEAICSAMALPPKAFEPPTVPVVVGQDWHAQPFHMTREAWNGCIPPDTRSQMDTGTRCDYAPYFLVTREQMYGPHRGGFKRTASVIVQRGDTLIRISGKPLVWQESLREEDVALEVLKFLALGCDHPALAAPGDDWTRRFSVTFSSDDMEVAYWEGQYWIACTPRMWEARLMKRTYLKRFAFVEIGGYLFMTEGPL